MIAIERVMPRRVLVPGIGVALAVTAAGSMLPPAPERNPERPPLVSGTVEIVLPARKPALAAPVREEPAPPLVTTASVLVTTGPPLPGRKPPRETDVADAGIPLPQRKPAPEPDTPGAGSAQPSGPKAWSEEEVADARAECARVLAGLQLDYAFADPIREGACGTAQPIAVRSIGRDPAIGIDPPAIVNCRLAASLARWIAEAVQPLARKALGGPIVRIDNATAYSCRNRYNAAGQKLSEHALANALDIGTFVTASGREIEIEDAWGPVARDILARRIAKEHEEARAKTAAAGKPGKESPADQEGAAHSEAAQAGQSGWEPAVATPAAVPVAAWDPAALGKTRKRDPRLADIVVPEPTTPEGIFVHGVHRSACGYFGTVLGPEANDAHRDHFHVDLAKRRHSAYCE